MSGFAPLWDSEGDPAFLGPAFELASDESWRGDAHPEMDEPGWPEGLAGPEYWLRKRELDDDDGA